MTEYGMIYDTSDIKRQLAEANRDYFGRKTWENLYSSINLSEQQQLNAAKVDYVKQISDAYSSAYKSKQAIASSNLGQGYKISAIADTDLALEEAYEAYRQNYLQEKSSIESSASEYTSGVNEALTTQAEYTKQFANTPYEYLKYIFDKYSEGPEEENIFLNDATWKGYTYTDEETGQVMLKSWEDIASKGTQDSYTDESGKVIKEWTGLYDSEGNLTIKGVDFYDKILNELAYKGGSVTFGKWLAETNEDLYNWSTSYNPYDYTTVGTNVGSFKTLVGMKSDDQQYSFIERFGGLTKTEVDTMYSKFTDKMAELDKKFSESSGMDSKELTTEFSSLTDEIKSLTDDLGITDALENDIGMSFNDLSSMMSELAKSSVSAGDVWWESILSAVTGGIVTGSTAATSFAAATAAGAKAAGTAAGLAGAAGASATVPIAGWILAGILAVAASVAAGVETGEAIKAQNRQLASMSREYYNDLVTNLVAYSHSKRKESQAGFYK